MKRDETGIKRISSTSWLVRVERRDERRGRTRNRKATVTGTKADAIAKRDELRDELASTTKRERVQLRVFAPAWLARRTLRDSTRRKYGYALEHFLPELGELFVDAIAPSDVAAYLQRRLAAGAAGNTVLNELRVLRVIAKDSVAEGLADRYWCERVKAPEVAHYDDDHPNLLTPAQAALVLEHVPVRWIALATFLLTTGVRIGEATALRWEDIDLGAATARIHRGNYRGTETKVKTKGSVRIVALLPEVLDLIAPEQAGWERYRGRLDALVFPTRSGTMHRGSPLRRALDKACAAAGVPRITTHGTRRTFNNEGRQVASREVLKATTGHQTDEMVGHYSHVGAGEKHELARAVASRLGVRPTSVRDSDQQGG